MLLNVFACARAKTLVVLRFLPLRVRPQTLSPVALREPGAIPRVVLAVLGPGPMVIIQSLAFKNSLHAVPPKAGGLEKNNVTTSVGVQRVCIVLIAGKVKPGTANRATSGLLGRRPEKEDSYMRVPAASLKGTHTSELRARGIPTFCRKPSQFSLVVS